MTLLIDSDVLIEILRGRDQGILASWTWLGESNSTLLFSPVSEAELWAGAFPKEEPALTALFSADLREYRLGSREACGAILTPLPQEPLFGNSGRIDRCLRYGSAGSTLDQEQKALSHERSADLATVFRMTLT